jgi:hypothetical protein
MIVSVALLSACETWVEEEEEEEEAIRLTLIVDCYGLRTIL